MTEKELNVDTPLSPDEEQEVVQFYEERADHLELDEFKNNTVLSSDSEDWVQALTGTGAKLFVGPRGCGKTHLMRFAFSRCKDNPENPFAVYTNLNRYYRLEPLLRKRPDAISMFYTWVLSNIFVGLYEAVSEFSRSQNVQIDSDTLLEFDVNVMRDLIGTVEQSRPLNDVEDAIAARLNVDRVKVLLVRATQALGRRRAVLLLDDAALTLTPEYLSHFFDIYRALKSARIAPKASVYPGTTEYGPNFHVAHDAESIFVWKAVTDGNYQEFMQGIGNKRFPDVAELPEEIRALLAYAAFGVPRSFMSLVRSYHKTRKFSPSWTPQSLLNGVIEDFCSDKMKEYQSLQQKNPQLATIITAGAECFNKMVLEVAEASQALAEASTRQIYIGVAADGVNGKPYVERMLRLLEEVGMVYRYPTVSHGDRDYIRYVPHLAALQNRRAFSRKGGFSPKFSLEMLQRPDEKHPVRRSISTLLAAATIEGLGLDLPNCLNCQTKRIEGAKYCFSCGAKLTDVSSYDRIMQSRLSGVPGLTDWQREALKNSDSVPKTVGEFLALQDRGTALRTIPRIGKKRAKTVIDAVEAFLEEYLS
jgi:hypothetical protein